MKRTALLRRSPMRRGTRKSKYARRPRDRAYLAFVRSLACSVSEEWPQFPAQPTPCMGPIDPDHDSRGRGLGQLSDDRTCIPLCRGHHDDRQFKRGVFKGMKRADIGLWFDRAQLRTRTLFAEAHGLEVA
jgi:hypothetical protein